MFQTGNLLKYAAFGGLAAAFMGAALKFQLANNIRRTDFYRDAMKTVRANKGAVYLLGEPIRDGLVDVERRSVNRMDLLEARYQVPVSGPKKKGTLHVKAVRESETDDWRLDSLQLALEDEPNRRLVIRDVRE